MYYYAHFTNNKFYISLKLYTKHKYIFYAMDNNLIYTFSILNLNS